MRRRGDYRGLMCLRVGGVVKIPTTPATWVIGRRGSGFLPVKSHARTGPGNLEDPSKERASVVLLPHIDTRTGAQKLHNAKPLIGVQLFCKPTSG